MPRTGDKRHKDKKKSKKKRALLKQDHTNEARGRKRCATSAKAGRSCCAALGGRFQQMPDEQPRICGVPARFFVLVLLVFQNAGAVLLMRYSRAMPGQGEFVTQTAVLMQEGMKAALCVVILLGNEGSVARYRIAPSCFWH